MKKQILLAGALLISFAAFSQTKENKKSEHGTQVRTVAKSETEAQAHGSIVSGVASSKSQGTAEAKAERLSNRSERMERNEARKEAGEDRREASAARREEAKTAKEVRADAIIGIEAGEKAEKGTQAEKEIKADKAVKAEIKGRNGSKAGVKTQTGTGVKLSRPNIKVGNRLNVGAGIF